MAALLVAVAVDMEGLTEVAGLGQVPAPGGKSFFDFECYNDCFLLADSLPSGFPLVAMVGPAVGEVTEDPMELTAAAVVVGKLDSTVLV
jgi:hypothetical protein